MISNLSKHQIQIAVMAGSLASLALGCEQPKEKVLDIKAPGVSVEVERSEDGAGVTVETPDSNEDGKLEIDTSP